MTSGRALVDSNTPEGIYEAIHALERQFLVVTSTTPVKADNGRYISSVYYSNETTNKEKTK